MVISLELLATQTSFLNVRVMGVLHGLKGKAIGQDILLGLLADLSQQTIVYLPMHYGPKTLPAGIIPCHVSPSMYGHRDTHVRAHATHNFHSLLHFPSAEARPNIHAAYEIYVYLLDQRRWMDEILPVQSNTWYCRNHGCVCSVCHVGSPPAPMFQC